MAEKDLKNLTKEELIELVEKQEKELKDARNERDIHKRMYDRLYKKVRTIQNIIEL
jgi:ribosomal protein L19E